VLQHCHVAGSLLLLLMLPLLCLLSLLPLLLLLLLLQGCAKCLDEAQAVVRIIRPLLTALVYLHDQGIIHRCATTSSSSNSSNVVNSSSNSQFSVLSAFPGVPA
jgi:hypothetical protein